MAAATRPTAVNLFWAIERMKRSFGAAAAAGESVEQIQDRLDREADAIHDEDVASCRAMGAFGAEVVPQNAVILTHCNAGALATAGYGTALGVIRGAVAQGKQVAVLADEDRNACRFLQGARLTAWELLRDGIETTVITDSMAGAIMRTGRIDLVVVGADRVAANGDTANKIGTYTVAILAREHRIPFYVAAPLSTIDLNTAGRLPDSDRGSARLAKYRAHIRGQQLTPDNARVRNPAFDVTPHALIAGIITERGIFSTRRTWESLRRAFDVLGRWWALSPWKCDDSWWTVSIAPRLKMQPHLEMIDTRHWQRQRHFSMRILGIETSCDETSAAIVEDTGDRDRPWVIRSNIVASQDLIHREWGGVVPELASRQHIRDICGVVERAMAEAGAAWSDLGAVAVTQGPGLVGSLLVGVSFAKAVATAAGVPLVPVHHLAGHIESLVLQHGELPLPAVVLVVSGGHTSLYLVERPGHYQLLSRTRDDAAGEAYDKVAKLLGLGYPGGPTIDRLAKEGNDRAVALPTTRLTPRGSQCAGAERRSRLQLQRSPRRPCCATCGRRMPSEAVPRGSPSRKSPTSARASSGSS